MASLPNATSSALKLGDLALTWDSKRGVADLVMIDADLASDLGLTTAILLSLMLDRRAEDDDQPPSGDPNDRRGWWADEFSAVEGDRIGSRLWLLDRSKRTNNVARLAKEYSLEALAWLLADGVAESVDVETENQGAALLIAVSVTRPGRDVFTVRYAHVWESMPV
jgi:phage gp46-like protein